MDTTPTTRDLRLIEAGFPCHQVGAETQRERDTGQSPPPHRLHVWWARRPLTPSRAAIVASLDPADTDPETFVRQLGIERVQALAKEQERRAENLALIARLRDSDPRLAENAVLLRWEAESQPLPDAEAGDELPVRRMMGDPAHYTSYTLQRDETRTCARHSARHLESTIRSCRQLSAVPQGRNLQRRSQMPGGWVRSL